MCVANATERQPMASKTTTWCDACGAEKPKRNVTIHGWILDACDQRCVDKLLERAKAKREQVS